MRGQAFGTDACAPGDDVIPYLPLRQWVLTLPIPLRLLLAAQPKLVTPVLHVVHRVITRHQLGQAGLKAAEADEAHGGAVRLIQRSLWRKESAANLNIHLHCLVLDGVYLRSTDCRPVFVEVPAPTAEAPHAVLHKIITRMMKLLTRRGMLNEEQGRIYMADNDGDSDEARVLRPPQAAACTYRGAFGPCAAGNPVDEQEPARGVCQAGQHQQRRTAAGEQRNSRGSWTPTCRCRCWRGRARGESNN